MNEHLRTTYLQHLGIESFVPRLSLPYAPRSDLCISNEPIYEGVVEPQSFAAETPNNSEPQAAASVVSGVIDSLQGNAYQSPADKELQLPVLSPPIAPVKPKPSELPKFALAVWRATVPLVVIDTHRAGAALPTERLLLNMLRHSLWKSPQLHRCEIQQWPLMGANEAESGWPEAKEMLGSFLDGVFAMQRVDRLWLMGEEAYRAANGDSVENEKAFSAVCFTEIILGKNATRAVVLPSLAEVLEKPLLKAKIWSLL